MCLLSQRVTAATDINTVNLRKPGIYHSDRIELISCILSVQVDAHRDELVL